MCLVAPNPYPFSMKLAEMGMIKWFYLELIAKSSGKILASLIFPYLGIKDSA